MIRAALLSLALAATGSIAWADSLQAPRLYEEGLDLDGPYLGEMVEGHAPGYFPIRVPARATLYPSDGGRFQILVTPNVIGYGEATVRAAEAATRYCGAQDGGVVAVIDAQARYSDLDLASYGFTGRCR